VDNLGVSVRREVRADLRKDLGTEAADVLQGVARAIDEQDQMLDAGLLDGRHQGLHAVVRGTDGMQVAQLLGVPDRISRGTRPAVDRDVTGEAGPEPPR
jgi:hypothetical protein